MFNNYLERQNTEICGKPFKRSNWMAEQDKRIKIKSQKFFRAKKDRTL